MRLGPWGAKLNTAQTAQFVDECLALGLKHFDLADIYGDYTNENDFGKLLKDNSSLRDRMNITTKCGIKLVSENRSEHAIKSYDLSSEHIRKSVDRSLKDLNTDRLDVFLLHRPDYLLDPHDIAEIFEALKKEGKVIEFGVSNFSTSQFELLDTFTPLVTNQIEVSLQHRDAFDNGQLDQLYRKGLVPTAWSPLGGGEIMTSSSNSSIKSIKAAAKVLEKKYDLELDQVLLICLLTHPSGIVPVLGTSKINRVKSVVEALKVKITREEWYSLWQAATGEEVA